MTYCRRCGWDPCRVQHAQITTEPPVDEPEDIEGFAREFLRG